MWQKLINALTSLKLTIACLVAAIVLVLAGTFAQVSQNLQLVQEHYFRSLLVWWPAESTGFRIPIFPGGHSIGAVLLVNLVAAHVRKFAWNGRKIGMHLTHGGLIVMLAGGLFTDLFSNESSMRISQGETKNYSEDGSHNELAIIDTSDSEFDQVTAIPQDKLRQGSLISHSSLPFSLAVRQFVPNSRLQLLSQAAPGTKPAATQAQGSQVALSEAPKPTNPDQRNPVSAVIELLPKATVAGAKDSLGTWLVSDALGGVQTFSCNGKTWTIALRATRHYKPYAITLNKFTHEKYPGTEIPKNFSSSILLTDVEKNASRDALIYMNHPLRYRGDTYYQSGFDDNDKTSILQVVHNPSVMAPYIGCIFVGLGMLYQFSLHLIGFSRRIRSASAS